MTAPVNDVVPNPGTGQPWAGLGDLCSPCDDYALDPAKAEQCLQIASDVLYNLTGRQWPGECTETVRPCAQYGTGGSAWAPALVGGNMVPGGRVQATWGSWGWCGCNRSRQCGCSTLSEVRLPGYPVTGITEVWLDGLLVDAGSYRLDDRRYLVWVGDSNDRAGWPCCQRMERDTDEDGTFAVAYTFGTGPPPGGVAACATLACDMLLACNPETLGLCRIIAGATNVQRQGVGITLIDPLAIVQQGVTGLPEVDLWVASVMLGSARRRATARRLGRSRAFRRTF